MFDLLAWAIAAVMVVISVMVHFETMTLISDRLVPWGLRRLQGRRTIILAMMALMLGHIAEIWLFALTLRVMSAIPAFGGIGGTFEGKVGDFLYLSAVNYTSLGYGEVYPMGSIRAIAVTEALTGLMMIGWSASFTYLKMEQLWQSRAARTQVQHARHEKP
ncbi:MULTISPECIES: ion channel [unclassified Variovorax]|uniref:ion channel n=1 Tax=unclassified Variovorax TaxID=663243 RepID=UPI001BD3FDA6|nr:MULTISPECIES: ion channel [unclassified Variovorax]